MANSNAPVGFQHIGYINGAAPSYALSPRAISSADTTAIYRGDPVVSQTTGYISKGSVGTTQVAGIFSHCRYLSSATGQTVESNYWPGTGAAANPQAYVIDSPNALFLVQSDNTAIGLADIQSNIGYSVGTGSTKTQLSGATVTQSTLGTTSTLPFRVVGLSQGIGTGSDSTSAYNQVQVAFNSQDYKVLTGTA